MKFEALMVLMLAIAGSAGAVVIVNLVAVLWYRLQEFQEECLGPVSISEATSSAQPKVLPISIFPYQYGERFYEGFSSASVGLKGVVGKLPAFSPRFHGVYLAAAGVRNFVECRHLGSRLSHDRAFIGVKALGDVQGTTRVIQFQSRNQFPVVLSDQNTDRFVVLQAPMLMQTYEPTIERCHSV